MPTLERAKLIPVDGPNDSPDTGNAVDVQFNPSTLKVALANTLKENKGSGNTRSAQFVDKSSSNLTVELLFDSTDDGSDVRQRTKVIAETFMKPIGSGDKLEAPKRCLFQWGAFEFLGMMQSFNETLDFFSPEGRPLRATLAVKFSEDRFQFRSRETADSDRATPSFASTGAGEAGEPPSQDGNSVNQSVAEAGQDQSNWRDTALFNGIESPRMPSVSALAVPRVSAGASIGASASIKASASISASASVGASAAFKGSAGTDVSAGVTPPPFKFGASASIGTTIPGAFSTGSKASAGLSAGGIVSGGTSLRGGAGLSGGAGASAGASAGAGADASAGASASAGVGFD